MRAFINKRPIYFIQMWQPKLDTTGNIIDGAKLILPDTQIFISNLIILTTFSHVAIFT